MLAQAGVARATQPPEARRAVRIYIYEFQICAGEALGEMLAKTRKYGLSLTLANQSLTQVDGRGRRTDAGEAALANAANLIAFRLGAPDALRLAPWFATELPWTELCRLPDFCAAVPDTGRRAADARSPHAPGIPARRITAGRVALERIWNPLGRYVRRLNRELPQGCSARRPRAP
jgi:hypothetical protein